MATGKPDLSFTELDQRATALIGRFNEMHQRMVDLLFELSAEDRDDTTVLDYFVDATQATMHVYHFLRADGLSHTQAEYGTVMSLIMTLMTQTEQEAKKPSTSTDELTMYRATMQRCVDKIKQLRSAS